MLEEFSFEMDIVSELNKERKPIHILKERYPDLYQLKANFFDSVLDISQVWFCYGRYTGAFCGWFQRAA